MRVITETLTNRYQTGKKMYRMARKYWADLDKYNLLDKPLDQVFNTVKNIPYQEDEQDEILARPDFLLNPEKFPALDCKKKGILMASWLEAHGAPWRLVATSEREDQEIHHVFPQVKIDEQWYNVDATYSDYNLYEPKPETTAAEELLG